ncbi:hypothetical protein BCR33DRAFT_791614 [Rhizoclosmatium globosum]|uniref:MSP domain-containing protein n=1 Tax=Rhizoclosmatium globosum TaxID=329046 RepID=A0A1Y2BDD0_9FUNG|nr:hypothetical protein BCR33DRAFT_791614 [Rhizoclosmatium globosum]|eukprot:ORY32716.1 hypothetical protein BCR33DRAFT_791614 [Rhizoclosmatium globosum]
MTLTVTEDILEFRRPLTRTSQQTLHLSNTATDNKAIAFRILSNASENYNATPARGLMTPGESLTVEIERHAMQYDIPAAFLCHDIIYVEFIPGLAPDVALSELWNRADKAKEVYANVIEKKVVKCTFDADPSVMDLLNSVLVLSAVGVAIEVDKQTNKIFKFFAKESDDQPEGNKSVGEENPCEITHQAPATIIERKLNLPENTSKAMNQCTHETALQLGSVGFRESTRSYCHAYKFDAMISLASTDRRLGEELYTLLISSGYSVWVYWIHMKGNMDKSMVDGIKQSSLFIPILSDDYYGRTDCMFELQTASADSKRAVILKKPGPLPPTILAHLGRLQYIEVGDHLDDVTACRILELMETSILRHTP